MLAVERVGEVMVLASAGFVVMVRGCEAVALVVEVALVVWEVAASDVGEPTVAADLAWNEGFAVVRARKEAKKLEKNGR